MSRLKVKYDRSSKRYFIYENNSIIRTGIQFTDKKEAKQYAKTIKKLAYIGSVNKGKWCKIGLHHYVCYHAGIYKSFHRCVNCNKERVWSGDIHNKN
ncbi:hypothetical protein [Paraliobacillus ryukyuensis]|uniref:hypothetical protein n=1 Tax=Paraliobacillus ryukyuensis TaxID=200904 RepID=UPI0009A582CB|nr:hypothetical protein [Paraliobacillus ryukyuensis]